MRMNPYFMFNGNAREAVAFYEKAFGAKVMGVQKYGDTPGDPHHHVSEGARDLIMHALIKVGETDLMFSDVYPGAPYQAGNNVNIAIVTDDADRSRGLFAALADGGQVIVPLQATFWSKAYGHVTDKFGVTWQITTEAKA